MPWSLWSSKKTGSNPPPPPPPPSPSPTTLSDNAQKKFIDKIKNRDYVDLNELRKSFNNDIRREGYIIDDSYINAINKIELDKDTKSGLTDHINRIIKARAQYQAEADAEAARAKAEAEAQAPAVSVGGKILKNKRRLKTNKRSSTRSKKSRSKKSRSKKSRSKK
jgi:hypothetical protein